MATPVRILIVEDRAADAELMLHELRKAGFEPEWQRVELEPDYLAALEKQPDLILSDWSLPQFSGAHALQILQERELDIPFIIVSGSIGEEVAVESMRKGATDYLLKERLARLGQAVLLALEDKQLRKERKQAEQALLESEKRYQELARISPVGIFRTAQNGSTTYVNPKWCQISGLSELEALGDGWLSAVHPQDKENLVKSWQESTRLQQPSFSDYRFVHPDGTITWVIGQSVPEINSENQIAGYVGTITDITDRKQAEEKLQKSEKRFRALVEHSMEEISLVDSHGTLLWESPNTIRSVTRPTRSWVTTSSIYFILTSVQLQPGCWNNFRNIPVVSRGRVPPAASGWFVALDGRPCDRPFG